MAVLAIKAIFRRVMRVDYGHKLPAGDYLEYIPFREGRVSSENEIVYTGRDFPC
jgi:hypothetical protein